MNRLGTLFLVLLAASPLAAAPQFPSQVEGLDIGNAILLEDGDDGGGVLVRSKEPAIRQLGQIPEWGFDTVIIFKNETRKKMVTREIAFLKAEGFTLNEAGQRKGKKRVYHLPMSYDESNYRQGCRYTLEALKIIYDGRERGRTVLFHCSHGQDRTGHLAGLYALLNHEDSAKKVFQEVLCKNGYGAGNPGKPAFVVKKIRRHLTPIFYNLVALIKEGKIRWDRLSTKVCDIPERPWDVLQEAHEGDLDFENNFQCER